MLVYYFLPFIVNNNYLLFQVSSGHNSVTVQNRTHVPMNFFAQNHSFYHMPMQCRFLLSHPVYCRYTPAIVLEMGKHIAIHQSGCKNRPLYWKQFCFIIISSKCRVCLINLLPWIFLFSQNFVVVTIPCVVKLTNKYFISKVITFICLLICILFSSFAICCEFFFVLYVYDRQSKLFSFCL